jgi:hypothetical protein
MSGKKTFEKDFLMIKYESVFNNEHVCHSFMKYLKTEFNHHPLECLVEIAKLREVLDDTIALESIKNILSTYIYNDSTSEINLSFIVKDKMFKTFEKQKEEKTWILEVKPQHFFDETQKVIEMMLFLDPWKRYIRSKFANDIYEKFSNDCSICAPKVSQKFNFNDEYFKHPFIEAKDFDFASSLFDDGKNWEVQYLFIYIFS